MKRFNGLLVLLLIATVLFTGCAKQTAVETEVAPEETVEAVEKLAFPLTLRVGYSTGPDDPRGVAIKHMKERVEAETDPENTASQSVLRRCGFVMTGDFGEEGPRFVLRKGCDAENCHKRADNS